MKNVIKLFTSIFFLFLILFFFSAKPALSSFQTQVVEFTNGNDPGVIVRFFLSPLPEEVVAQRTCILYDNNHVFVNNGSVMNPAIGCNFFSGGTYPDGAYTMELLNQSNDVNNPLAVSTTFYVVNGKGSLLPPAEPTPIPENLPPQINQPQYTVLNVGDTYHQTTRSFIDDDSSSWTATIDYDDGSGTQPLLLSGKEYILDHQYMTAGMRLVKISATDEHGNTGSATGVVAIVPPDLPAPSRTITNLTYTYTSPNIKTLVIEFTPDATFSSFCMLYANATTTGRTATSKTNHSCTFQNLGFSIDYSNLSLLMYDGGGVPTIRTDSVFYTPTQLFHVTNSNFNNNNLFVNADIPIRENCSLLNEQFTTIASGSSGGNTCAFSGYGYNGPFSLPDGIYYLRLNSGGVVSNAFTIHRPIRPEIAPLLGAIINIEEIYTETGSFTDSDSSSWTATVDYGDGLGNELLPLDGTHFSLSHHYINAGTHTVSVSITDDQNVTNTSTTTVTVNNPQPITVTFNASGDTYLRDGAENTNTGAGQFMQVRNSGNNRSLVKFDQSALQSTIGNGTVLSAKLRLTITDNGNNWGSSGRTVDLHRMIASWTEGNGTENDKGNGSGSTWNCATDTNIHNAAKNCSGSTEWQMGQPNNPNVHPWNATATDTKTITNNQSGVVEYDVTSDVASFLNGTNNYGWLLKKTNEGQNGQVSFGTRESSAAPQLVVTYQP